RGTPPRARPRRGSAAGRLCNARPRLRRRRPRRHRRVAGYARLKQNWLDRGRPRPHIGPMLIETEATPNPATFKFLPGRTVMEAGTRDFATYEEAEASPLAEALFALGDVEGVFFGRDFVSVTAAPGVAWSDLKP